MEILNTNRIAAAKHAFSTRRVPIDAMRTLVSATPEAGDLVLARINELGYHKSIELPTGRKAFLAPGDEVVLAFGNRYAPDQFEALVPSDLAACHMVAAGGIASRAVVWHERVSMPTAIEPIGLVGDHLGQPLNVAAFSVAPEPTVVALPPAIVVYGTSMNAGKTTTVASLVRGLSRAGFSVGAAKLTGTGAGNDLWSMIDAGAVVALDFTDAGFATTYRMSIDAIIAGTDRLLRGLSNAGAEIAVVEVADGLYQPETAALAASPALKTMTGGVLFAAGDAMGAIAGIERLQALGHDVMGVSGLVTRSPLACREVAAADVPVYGAAELADPKTASAIVAPVATPRLAGAVGSA